MARLTLPLPDVAGVTVAWCCERHPAAPTNGAVVAFPSRLRYKPRDFTQRRSARYAGGNIQAMSRGGFDRILIALITGGIVGFFIGYAVNYDKGGGAGGPTGVEVAAADIDVKPMRELEPSAKKGGDAPKVIIHEVSEFQCPFCSKVVPTMKQITDTYGDQVQLVFVHNPLSFHDKARAAAIASMAARRQGKFWEYHDTLFANQQSLDDASLLKFAEELGLDAEKFKADLKDPAIAKKVDADQGAAVALGATGTPGFFVNGINLSGAKPFEEFKTIIDAEIAKADQAIAAGTPKEKVAYALMAKNNQKALDLLVRNMPTTAPRPATAKGDAEVWKVSLRGDEPQMGPNDALVTIVEWSDFQCPFCGKVVPTLKQVKEEYAGKVRVIFKHLPLSFHDKAQLAAEASMAAHAEGKFWEYGDKLFENQQALDRADLERYAQEIGLDIEKFKAALDNGTYKAVVLADASQAGEVKASGTPTFFINGKLMDGGKAFEDFKAAIDAELEVVQKLVDKGTAPDKLYETLIAKGKLFTPLDDKVQWIDTKDSPTIGKTPARIVITEFSEFECPFCSRVGPALKPLKEIYGDDIAIVFKHFPLSFHKNAMPAAIASMAANEQGKFWEYHDLLFENQKSLSAADLELYAQQVGLDMAKFKAAVGAEKYKDKVQKDMAEGSRIGVQGTPSVFINGRKFSPAGGYSTEGFQAAIDKYILKK
ncbi:MAG: hypothetical protein AMXMBFR23_28620 [Chloroflexota bacterium]